MKQSLKVFSIFIAIHFIAINCSQEKITKSNGQLQFSFAQKMASNSGGRVTATATPAFALLSIKDSQGTLVQSSKKIALYNFGGSFVTESLQLNVGGYSLTQFMILDSANNVLYATPMEGSDLAQYVTDPLPINFSITANGTTLVTPQVMAVTPQTPPESFGYVSFGFEVVTKLKLKKIIYGEDTITYSYTGNNLTSVTANDVPLALNYFYDSYGRLSKIDHYQNNVFFESKIYLYDSIGRLQSIIVPTTPSDHSHRVFSYTNGRISEVDVRPGELSFHEKRFIEYDSALNPVKITIHGYDSNEQESWVTTELYTFDTKSPITNSFHTDLFVGLTYVLPLMDHFAGLSLSHNITSLKTSTYWTWNYTSPFTNVWSVFEYNSLGYPIKETIYTSAGATYYPGNGAVKQYFYE